jgi:hypothetical protein
MFRFLVSRNQIDLLRECVGEAAAKVCIAQALNVATMYGKRLHALVRRGGDVCEYDPGDTPSPYQDFISINTNWIDRVNCPTIFNMNDNLVPLIWYQEDSSSVCYLIASALAIFYRQSLDSGVSSVGLYALNLDRFMRNYLSDDDIYKTVFGLVGGFSMDMLELMLKKQNPRAKSVADYQHLFLKPEIPAHEVFMSIKRLLAQCGSLIIEMPAQNEVTFHGDTATLRGGIVGEQEGHALLIVGVCLIEHLPGYSNNPNWMGGVAFLLQNSLASKPFFIVGRDLLLSMGVQEVIAIRDGLTFNVGECQQDDITSFKKRSGSPRTPQGNGQRVPLTPMTTTFDDFDPSLYERVDAKTCRYRKS